MKRHNDNLRDVFDRLMPPAPTGALEGAAGRVLRRLREGRHHEAMKEQPAVSSPRIGLRFAVAAVLIMTVAIGVYAFRAQRASSSKVVVPAAQDSASSVKAATETPQVAVITPESRKPEAAPSREEIHGGVAAQIAAAQATDAGPARPKFAAASVRLVPYKEYEDRVMKEPDILGGMRCLGADGLLFAAPNVQDPAARRGRCIAKATDVRPVVYAAYGSSRMPSWNRLAGWPRESFPEIFFQIEGVADDPEHVTKGELKLMLQTLFEDRFKARVHVEMREVDGYVLTIAKSGIKFKETSGDPSCKVDPRFRTPAVNGKCRMGGLAAFLREMLGSDYPPLADKTGLMGIYDIEFLLDAVPSSPPTGGGVRGESGIVRQFTTPIAKALEEQLGLHLERVKVPAEHVVVDHIEHPTEN